MPGPATIRNGPRSVPTTCGRKDRAVKVDAVVVGWAEMVAKARGITVAEYLSETLRKPVARDFADVMEKMKGGQD